MSDIPKYVTGALVATILWLFVFTWITERLQRNMDECTKLLEDQPDIEMDATNW